MKFFLKHKIILGGRANKFIACPGSQIMSLFDSKVFSFIMVICIIGLDVMTEPDAGIARSLWGVNPALTIWPDTSRDTANFYMKKFCDYISFCGAQLR